MCQEQSLLFPSWGGEFRVEMWWRTQSSSELGMPLPQSRCWAVAMTVGRTDMSCLCSPPSSSSLIPLPELRGNVWVGSLLGGLPRLPRDPWPHPGPKMGLGRPQTTLSCAFFSSDADSDSDGEEEPVVTRWWKSCRGLLVTDHSWFTEQLPALCCA